MTLLNASVLAVGVQVSEGRGREGRGREGFGLGGKRRNESSACHGRFNGQRSIAVNTCQSVLFMFETLCFTCVSLCLCAA